MKVQSSRAPGKARSAVGEHRLRPLLATRSIALVGGSPCEGSVGNLMIRSLVKGGFRGDSSVVNPKYDSVEGLAAFPSLRDLPHPPDLAVVSVASRHMEALMREAIEAGVRAAVVFDFCRYEGDREPLLLERLQDMPREADFPICGGNGMGYFRVRHYSGRSRNRRRGEAHARRIAKALSADLLAGTRHQCRVRERDDGFRGPGHQRGQAAARRCEVRVRLPGLPEAGRFPAGNPRRGPG